MWEYLYILPGAFLVPLIHEWVKAVCSSRLGDPTPKNRGFLSGNPLKYFEPVGFFLILMTGYGWGQPVLTSPLHYKNRRRGVLITYITPSVSILLIGIVTALLIGAFANPIAGVSLHILGFLRAFATVCISLAVFNIIPVYPLHGARVLQLFLPADKVAAMNRHEKIFQVVLLLLLLFGFAQSFFLSPITEFIYNTAVLAFTAG